jgi:hypothetical protein
MFGASPGVTGDPGDPRKGAPGANPHEQRRILTAKSKKLKKGKAGRNFS